MFYFSFYNRVKKTSFHNSAASLLCCKISAWIQGLNIEYNITLFIFLTKSLFFLIYKNNQFCSISSGKWERACCFAVPNPAKCSSFCLKIDEHTRQSSEESSCHTYYYIKSSSVHVMDVIRRRLVRVSVRVHAHQKK